MKYIYAALMLHESGKEINEDSMKKILEATGNVDEARVKVLIESLKGVNIDEAIKTSVQVSAPAAGEAKAEEKKEEKKEEMASEGLAALFG